MKKLLIAAACAALVFPAAAQENLWNMAVRKPPVEQLEELVGFEEMFAPPEVEEPWLFSVVSNSEQVSSIVQAVTGNTSAIVVSLPALDYDDDSDLAFRSGMAVERLMQGARRHPGLAMQLIAPPADLSADIKDELGIPSDHKAIAVLVVAERPMPPAGGPRPHIGMGGPAGFGGRGAEGRDSMVGRDDSMRPRQQAREGRDNMGGQNDSLRPRQQAR